MGEKCLRSLGFVLVGVIMGFFIRCLFLFANYPSFSALTGSEIFFSFLYGIRFDLSSFMMINGAFLLVYLSPLEVFLKKFKVRISFVISITVVNVFFMICQFFDTEYYKLRGKRLTQGSFALLGEFMSNFFSTFTNYPWQWLGLLVTSLAFYYFTNKIFILPKKQNGYLTSGLYFLGFLLFAVFSGRGGFQMRPLIPANGIHGNNPLTAHLTTNSAFTILKSEIRKELAEVHYYSSWNDLVKILPKKAAQKPDVPAQFRPNIVVIILESFGSEYLSSSRHPQGFAPFLSGLAQKSVSFKYSYSNGRRSIESLTSVFAGIPNLMEEPLILSPYQTNNVQGLPKILKSQGYFSAFFHGGYNGTMFFDTQAAILGFEKYIGANEYKKSMSKESFKKNVDDDDGYWGIYDEPFLHYTALELTQLQSPFLAGIFTLSSHFPYAIPKKYSGKFPKGTLKIHETIGYSDKALEQFFAEASQQPWYDDTIFVITGDHTSLSEDKEFQTPLNFFRVPIMFYAPKIKLDMSPNRSAQHIDIMPTIVDLIGLDQLPRARFGKTLIQKSQPNILLSSSGKYYFIEDQIVVEGSLDEPYKAYDFARDPKLINPLDLGVYSKEIARLKSYIQYYNNGLRQNRLNF